MVKRNFARPFYPQNYDFAVFFFFCPRNLRMTGRSIQFAAKAVLMNRQKNLIIFNFTIFPSNLKKQKYKYMRFKIMSVYWATLHVYIKLKTLALIEAKKLETENFFGEKEKWTDKGNDKQQHADSLFHNTTSHTQHLDQMSQS